MTVLTQVDMGTLGRVGTALADPTRRRVLVHLISSPGYPAEMAACPTTWPACANAAW